MDLDNSVQEQIHQLLTGDSSTPVGELTFDCICKAVLFDDASTIAQTITC